MQIGEFGADEPDWLYDEEYGCWYSSWDIAEWSQEDEYWEQHPEEWEEPVGDDDTVFQTLEEWDSVRALVKEFGMRNSNVMAIAPTATISYIQGCSQSIEPDYSVLFVYSTLSGEFTMIMNTLWRLLRKKEFGLKLLLMH